MMTGMITLGVFPTKPVCLCVCVSLSVSVCVSICLCVCRLGLMSHTRRNSISTSRDSWSKTGLSETHCSSNGPVVSCVYVMSARLLRLHKKCVEDARRRLEEYQHALKLRHAIGSTSVPLALNPDALHASQLPPRPAPLTGDHNHH